MRGGYIMIDLTAFDLSDLPASADGLYEKLAGAIQQEKPVIAYIADDTPVMASLTMDDGTITVKIGSASFNIDSDGTISTETSD